jgi:hypothetical protein
MMAEDRADVGLLANAVLGAMPDIPDEGGLMLKWPWTVAVAFGCIECGYGDDKWRQLWNGRRGAEAYARHLNGYRFGQHVVPVPLPEIGDAP